VHALQMVQCGQWICLASPDSISEERSDMSPADTAVAAAVSQALLHQVVPEQAFAC